MTATTNRYSISRRKRLIDTEPMERGELPLVWSPDRGEWVSLELTFGEHVDAVPITDEEAQHFMATGEISSMRTAVQMGALGDSSDIEE
jgi:hypothetical protein